MKSWNQLPQDMKNDKVKEYYIILQRHKIGLVVKRAIDFLLAGILLIVLSPVFLALSVWIKVDSKGPIIFKQIRVTQYGRTFNIYKFRTMVSDAEKCGTQVTTRNDSRVTKVGRVIRRCRLDELPQLVNVLCGDMSFVGTRPEVPRYVQLYSDEMRATLLLPAGITSWASIMYKDEERLLEDVENADEIYVKQVLPEKMRYNLETIKKFSLLNELKTMIYTVIAVLK